MKKQSFSQCLRSLLMSRTFRCGGYSALLTALIILLVLAVNHLAAILETRYSLTADFSFNALTVQSETTASVLKSLDRDVHVYYVHTNAGMTTSSLSEDDMRVLLGRYQTASSRLTWSEENIVQNPAFSEQYADLLTGKEITANCLVVRCEETGRVRVLDENDFVSRSYDMNTGSFQVTGYTVEKNLTEALLYVSRTEVPTLQVLTGHGELTTADLAHMTSFLSSNSYDVQRVSAAELNTQYPLLIACPQFDLTQEELELLLHFAQQGGTFLVLSRFSDPAELPRFGELFLYFGLRILPGLCVADAEDKGSYYNDSPAILAPYMQTVPELAKLTQDGRDFLLLTGARAFDILTERDSSIFTESLLKSGSAYLHSAYEESLDKAPDDPEGYFDLAVYARRFYEDNSSSRMIMVGNADLFCEQWMMENTYSPEFLLALLQTLNGENALDLNILQKNAVRAPLRSASMALPAILSLLLPLLIFILAVLILVPRRNL